MHECTSKYSILIKFPIWLIHFIATTQLAESNLSGMFILGTFAIHFLSDVVLVYIVLKQWPGSRLSVALTWTICGVSYNQLPICTILMHYVI